MALKYKVGDRVRIKSLDWYNKNIKNNGIIICGSESFTHPMSHFCDKVVTIVTIQDDCYRILEDDGDWYWTDEMIEGLAEEEEIEFTEEDKYWCDIMSESDPTTYVLPQGYQFVDENGNVINATKIVLEKKKKEYPKTYGYCCDTLECCSYNVGFDRCETSYDDTLHNKLLALRKLIICRDAYWKIAGEEMGLGKSWKPDWDDDEWPDMYYISFDGKYLEKEKGYPCCNMILIFPTEEMRDAFYENFKGLIEECKELL